MSDVLQLRAGIVGVSGYSGMELARILAVHPSFTLSLVTPDKWQGQPLGPLLAVGRAAVTRVVDLSGAFRLAADEYPSWCGFEHGQPDLLREAVYSMPEAADAND